MSLSREEQETIIIFNQADDTASIETFNGPIIRACQKYGAEPEIDSWGAHKFTVPKSWVKIRGPREMSDEARAAQAQRMREIVTAQRQK